MPTAPTLDTLLASIRAEPDALPPDPLAPLVARIKALPAAAQLDAIAHLPADLQMAVWALTRPTPRRRNKVPTIAWSRWIRPNRGHFRLMRPEDRCWAASILDAEPVGDVALVRDWAPKPAFSRLVAKVWIQAKGDASTAAVEMRPGIPLSGLPADLVELLGGASTIGGGDGPEDTAES